ncbi:Histidine kinase [Lambiella insularis]|nr:Histidine kinase [Lambiella insularis]
MRIGIREQLAVVVLLAALVPLAVLAILTWVNNYNFVVDIKSQGLSLTASLKATEISSDLVLIQTTCQTIVTRLLFQNTLKSFYTVDNLSSFNWSVAHNDLFGGLSSGGLSALLQVTVFSRNETGNPKGLLNVTTSDPGIMLPQYSYSNGTSYMLGDAGLGYPPPLYPNISYSTSSSPDPADSAVNETLVFAFADYPLNNTAALLLGPLQINASYALVSLTLPIIDNEDTNIVIGYMTVVAAATSLINTVQSREGLDDTGTYLIVGPNSQENQFDFRDRPATADYSPSLSDLGSASVRYVFSPNPTAGQADRHPDYNANLTKYGSSGFTMINYPAILAGFGEQNQGMNNASSMLSTTNENGMEVAVGFARPQGPLVDWLVVVEQSHSEAWAPITSLRNILLACVFGTFGVVLLLVVPLAHFGVRPIRRLRDATEKSVAPPGSAYAESVRSNEASGLEDGQEKEGPHHQSNSAHLLKRFGNVIPRKLKFRSHRSMEGFRFRIPAKVQDRKHIITDELTELTSKSDGSLIDPWRTLIRYFQPLGTFNNMTEQLMLQYTGLEEKVAERTRELELSKRAAEAANESKTLFIANISHELRTPLNGILGMCAVCMGDDDLLRIQRSLQIVYKSGDLLLNLLNDLLTFSKNQIGQQLTLEEKEFNLADIKSQLTAIFEKQAREGKINLYVRFSSNENTENAHELPSGLDLPALGPNGIGRLKDLCLWGDQHRILQVLINLISNSLKFTPENGKVEVRIKCLGEVESFSETRRNSSSSKQSSQRDPRHRQPHRPSSQILSKPVSSTSVPAVEGTALSINPMDPKATPHVRVRERSPTPPPPGARSLMFEFEVEDTGPGIPEHFQKSVFEPFVQADLGLNKKYGGTGLGLSICSQLASLMGGDISLVSTVNVGTTFKLKIPLKFVKERASSIASSEHRGSRTGSVHMPPDDTVALGKASTDAVSANALATNSSTDLNQDSQPRLVGLSRPFFATIPSPVKSRHEQLAALDRVVKVSGTKTRVLVAEDNLVNQEVVLRMLKLEDIYDVVIAKDGQEAYDKVKESKEKGQLFDLIFMDVQMPNLDGLQSTRLIRQMGYAAPIVALTAFVEESNVKDCYDSGMNMFLSKPIRRAALKQVLKKFSTISEEGQETATTSSELVPAGKIEAPAR